LNKFAERLGVLSACFESRRARTGKLGQREDLVSQAAAIPEVKLDDLFCEARHLLPDLRGDIKAVVTLCRRSRDASNSSSK